MAPNARADDSSFAFVCQQFGAPSFDPLGDREGHGIRSSQFSCVSKGGLFDGGVVTGSVVYESDKSSNALLSGSGIVRKPGATSVYNLIEGKYELVMVDGKVTGITTSGKGVWASASGAAAALNGKPFTYTSHPTGPGLFEIDGQ